MKTSTFAFSRLAKPVPCLLPLLLALTLPAQDDPSLLPPANSIGVVVTIHASDSDASEAGPDSGFFTVRRSGGTNVPLLVFFELSGTAQNGTDYQTIGSSVLIPEGASLARIEVAPLGDALIEGNETVIARLTPSPVVGPLAGYWIGSPSNAIVTIADDDRPVETNRPPRIEIVSPPEGAIFPGGTSIFIAAHATDLDGYVATVEFFANSNRLAITTNNPLAMNPVNPFQFVWSDAPPGEHVLTARATDNDGLSAWSQSVRIKVRPGIEQTVVNVYATDSVATEIPEVPPGQERPQLYDPAIFTVTRAGNTNIDLPVFYRVGSTASNGVDYTELTGTLTIPAGHLAARIEVSPIDDLLVEGIETVVVAIEAPACIAIFPPPPECYLIGQNGRAEAVIVDDEVKPTNNIPPSVRITAPINGATFPAPADIAIHAVTVDPDGYASTVEFFANATKIGEATIFFFREPDPGTPIEFDFQWRDVPAGNYALTARTRDDDGAMAISASVWVRVGVTNPPPPTNLPPVVTIVARDAIAAEGTNCWWLNASPWLEGWERWGVNPGGRNTATFVVTRSDGTNNPLTVYYSVSGSASNGTDYFELPGAVTIPAGRRSARIEVAPLEDNLAEGVETVIITVENDVVVIPTNTDPAIGTPPEIVPIIKYVPGHPRRAAALIVDNDRPRPPCFKLRDGPFHFCLPATNGFCHRIEVSTNLVHWMPVCTNVVTDGALHFVDPDAADSSSRFYLAIPEPVLLPED